MTTKKNTYPFKLSASMICADPLNLISDIKKLERGNIDYIHFDVMDGHFVPRLGLYPEVLKKIKSVTNIPVDVHLMVSNPEDFISDFVKARADIITVHAESTNHLHRVIHSIKQAGVRVGVALNPATTIDSIKYLINDLDLILIMAINPGIVGHKLIPSMINKIRETKDFVDNRKIFIQVDGGVNLTSGSKMIKAGANMLVCGTSTIFNQKLPLTSQIKKYRQILLKEI
jgi:ribulose-phosphate 3-epimerase